MQITYDDIIVQADNNMDASDDSPSHDQLSEHELGTMIGGRLRASEAYSLVNLVSDMGGQL